VTVITELRVKTEQHK